MCYLAVVVRHTVSGAEKWAFSRFVSFSFEGKSYMLTMSGGNEALPKENKMKGHRERKRENEHGDKGHIEEGSGVRSK